MVAFTDRSVKAIEATSVRQEILDDGCPGLLLIVQPSGVKSWAWRGRLGGKVVKRTLGRFGAHSLSDAHEWAQRINKYRDQGIDIIAQDEAEADAERIKADAEKAEADRLAEFTCDWAFGLYMEAEGDLRRTGKAKWREWRKDVSPHIGKIPLHLLTLDDLTDAIEKRAETSQVMANRNVSLIKRWLKWSVTKGRSKTGLTSNPSQDLFKPADENSRDHFLSEYEIVLFLRSLNEPQRGTQFPNALRLLLYTGCRRNEVIGASWSEFNLRDREWVIPKERSKNKLPHLVYLTDPVMEVLNSIPRVKSTDLLFPSPVTPTNPISGITGAMNRLRERMENIAAKEKRTIEFFTPHDLRRTVSTSMSAMRDEQDKSIVLPHVVEAVLNHVSGAAKAGVAGVYNRYQYYAEKKQALILWANKIDLLMADPQINVSLQPAEVVVAEPVAPARIITKLLQGEKPVTTAPAANETNIVRPEFNSEVLKRLRSK